MHRESRQQPCNFYWTNMILELHPLSALFPRMEGAEFESLAQDIKANGLREPIVTHQGMILDGGNRYKACLSVGVEPRFVEHDGSNIVTFVLSANLHRRHLTTGQQAAIVASAQDWSKAQTVGNPQFGKITGLETVADRTRQSGASDKTQRDADKVAKANPELAKKVAHGEVSLKKAVDEVTGKKEKKEEYNPDDPSHTIKELAHALEESAKENASMKSLIGSLESGDSAQEIAKLHEQIARLEGRLQQEITTKNEAMKSARYYKGILDKVAKKLGVEKHSEILGAMK